MNKVIEIYNSKISYNGFKVQDLVVEKPWGFEYAYENEDVALWALHSYENETSLHCHQIKI